MLDGMIGPMNIDWSLLWLIIQGCFWIGILLVLAVWTIRRSQYKYWIVILDRTGDKDQVITIDEAKVVKTKKGIKKLWLKGERKHYSLIDFKYKRRCKGGGLKRLFKQGAYVLYRYGEDSYTPVDVNSALKMDGLELNPIDSEMAQMNEHFEQLEEKTDYKSVLQEYLPLITTVGSGVIIIGLVVIIMIMMQDVTAGVSSAAGKLAEGAASNGETQRVILESVRTLQGCSSSSLTAPGFGG